MATISAGASISGLKPEMATNPKVFYNDLDGSVR